MTVQVEEILRRTEHGVTEPYLCRCDDGQIYFVKGMGAGRRSLVCEWVAGSLGRALGLPVAPFDIVDVADELIQASNNPLDLTALGRGLAFGSQRCEAMEITAAAVRQVPPPDKCDVLAFDWWIRNEDRTLTEKGGNPNLLWEPANEKLVVIDHNQAFDTTFNRDNFLNLHVFQESCIDVFGDMVARRDYTQRFTAALERWHEITDAVPEQWLYVDDDMTETAPVTLEELRAVLDRIQSDDFWNTSS